MIEIFRAEAGAENGDGLGCQSDLGEQHDSTLAAAQKVRDEGEHDRRLAAACDTVKQSRVGLTAVGKIAQRKIGLLLLLVEYDRGQVG